MENLTKELQAELNNIKQDSAEDIYKWVKSQSAIDGNNTYTKSRYKEELDVYIFADNSYLYKLDTEIYEPEEMGESGEITDIELHEKIQGDWWKDQMEAQLQEKIDNI